LAASAAAAAAAHEQDVEVRSFDQRKSSLLVTHLDRDALTQNGA
jgi:hypothetical protein